MNARKNSGNVLLPWPQALQLLKWTLIGLHRSGPKCPLQSTVLQATRLTKPEGANKLLTFYSSNSGLVRYIRTAGFDTSPILCMGGNICQCWLFEASSPTLFEYLQRFHAVLPCWSKCGTGPCCNHCHFTIPTDVATMGCFILDHNVEASPPIAEQEQGLLLLSTV